MKKKSFLRIAPLILLAAVTISCTEKKKDKEAADQPASQSSVEAASASTSTELAQPEEQVKRKPAGKSLAGKDCSDNKKTCSMCNGTGKQGKEQCKECLGYGYILVYK